MTPQELTQWRRDRRLTQIALAELLGRDKQTINRWERGTRRLPPDLALTLAGLEQKMQEEKGR